MKCIALKRKCPQCQVPRVEREEKCSACGADLHCNKGAVQGYTLCTAHGGPAPSRGWYGKGGQLKTGENSQFQITRLAAKYNQMLTDGVLLSNRAAIEMIDGRIKQLLERVDVEEAPDRVAKLYMLWSEFKETPEHTPEWLQARMDLDEEFDKIYHDYKAWEQIFQALDLRGKAVEREVKTLHTLKLMMSAEDAYNLLAKALAASMKVMGDDPKKLKELEYEYSRIIGESGDRARERDVIENQGGDTEGDGEA